MINNNAFIAIMISEIGNSNEYEFRLRYQIDGQENKDLSSEEKDILIRSLRQTINILSNKKEIK